MTARKVLYVTGTRADFGLMAGTLHLIDDCPELDLSLCVTGMHLDKKFGNTIDDVEASGLKIAATVPAPHIGEGTGESMVISIGEEITGMTPVFARERPDLVMVLGDRGEMLAAALVALHLNIPVVHVHGGERSGTVDEPVRHAISRLSHFHFVATEGAAERLERMGEEPGRIFVTGAPGLDALADFAVPDRAALFRKEDFDPEQPLALVVYHPVVQDANAEEGNMRAILQAVCDDLGMQALILQPNSDAGGDAVRAGIEAAGAPGSRVRVHLPREEFLGWMACADVMVGNSSSGIIEAASFGTPVVNVGSRQNLRERNQNIIDCAADRSAVLGAAQAALRAGRFQPANVYGDGGAGKRIVKLLRSLPMDASVLMKCNVY